MEVIQGDITDYSSVLEASRGAHVIVHMASLVDVWYKIPDSLIYSVNIKGEAPTGLVEIRDGEKNTHLASVFIRETTNGRKSPLAWRIFKDL